VSVAGFSVLELYDIYGKMKRYNLFRIFQRPRKKYKKFSIKLRLLIGQKFNFIKLGN
jgi:hypothetical protein